MTPSTLYWISFLQLCLVVGVNCHICLISPRQRGSMNISSGGSHTCTRHGAECGGQPPSPMPYMEVMGGQPIFIKWQQNLNHYDVGYPGYMDIAIATANKLVPSDPFVTLATIEDVNQYDQGHQQNYTAVVTLPNMDCDHCVIRARYVAHKPGETTFYQCADVKIIQSTKHELHHEAKGHLQLLDTNTNSYDPQMQMGKTEQDFKKHRKNVIDRKHIKKDENTNGREETTITPKDTSSQEINDIHQDYSGNNEQGELHLRRALSFLREHSSQNLNMAALGPNAKLSTATPVSNMNKFGTPPSKMSRPDKLYGMTNIKDTTNGSIYLAIDTLTGERTEINRMPFGIDLPSGNFVTDGVMTFDTARGLTLMTYNRHDNMNDLADSIMELKSDTGTVQNINNISAYHNINGTSLKSAFSAIIVEIEDTYVTFHIDQDSRGNFYFFVGRLHRGGSWEQLATTDKPENLYVNFLWADYDISIKTLHVLLGNENDPWGLSARLYKFIVPPSSVQPTPDPINFYSFIEVNMTTFPFLAFHLSSSRSDQLYAISPGTWYQTYPSYHLVVVNIDTGSVTEVAQLTPPGIFSRYYGGTVINGFNTITNELLHVLHVADTQADVIMHVNINTKRVHFSQVTNLRNVKNVAYPWNVV